MHDHPANPGHQRMPGPGLLTGATGPLGSTITAGLPTAESEVLGLARNRERAAQNRLICTQPPAKTA
jgi:uncharacterized protein YbjT (DUF2867 family)